MNPVRAFQEALAARLHGDAGVAAIAANTPSGPAVFAVGQAFDDVYPRVTLEAPQWIPARGSCGRSGELFATLHSWSQGDDCTLVAGDLAHAVELALATMLAMPGWRVSSFSFEGSRPVGDPAPGVEHFVSTLRYSVQQTG